MRSLAVKERKSKLPAVREAREIALRRRKRHPNRALTEAQIRLLLHAIDNIRDDALIWVPPIAVIPDPCPLHKSAGNV